MIQALFEHAIQWKIEVFMKGMLKQAQCGSKEHSAITKLVASVEKPLERAISRLEQAVPSDCLGCYFSTLEVLGAAYYAIVLSFKVCNHPYK